MLQNLESSEFQRFDLCIWLNYKTFKFHSIYLTRPRIHCQRQVRPLQLKYGTMTLIITIHGIITLSITRKNWTLSIMTLDSVMLSVAYAKCLQWDHYDESANTEFHYSECRGTLSTAKRNQKGTQLLIDIKPMRFKYHYIVVLWLLFIFVYVIIQKWLSTLLQII